MTTKKYATARELVAKRIQSGEQGRQCVDNMLTILAEERLVPDDAIFEFPPAGPSNIVVRGASPLGPPKDVSAQ